MVKTFGKGGNEIYLHANGIDNSPVVAHIASDVKSIGRSTTLPEDISDIEKAKIVLMDLADDIGMTARRHGKKGRTVHITLKYSGFSGNHTDRQPFLQPVRPRKYIRPDVACLSKTGTDPIR